MSFAWHQIHDHLMRTSSTLRFQRSFDALRRASDLLAPFRDPAAMLDALHHGPDGPDRKNLILTALVEAAQNDVPASDCALTVLLLALWPGLDAIRRRSIWRRPRSADDIAADLLVRTTEAVRGINLERVNRIAATVLRNIERDMIRARQREAERESATKSIGSDEMLADRAGLHPTGADAHLHADIRRLIGADATLVIRVAVEGFSQAEAAVDIGLSEAATRKRYQRATRKLRDVLQEIADPVSQSAGVGDLWNVNALKRSTPIEGSVA